MCAYQTLNKTIFDLYSAGRKENKKQCEYKLSYHFGKSLMMSMPTDTATIMAMTAQM